MQYSFRLAELLKHEPDPRKRPGTIKAVVEYTGLDRHQVASLLKNEVKYIPLQALSSLCDYLIENGFATADQLPGALFGIEPENFWEMLARRRRLQVCLGVRRDMDPEEAGGAFISASDSVMMGEILNGVTTLGGTAVHREHGNDKMLAPTDEHDPLGQDIAAPPVTSTPLRKVSAEIMDNNRGVFAPQPEHLIQSLVWSPGQMSEKRVVAKAQEVYKNFSDTRGDKALVCLGSTKSNPVVELVISHAFACDPFVTQDDVADANDRKCPFYMRFRDEDPQPPSLFGGKNLSKKQQAEQPGIYYEAEDGQWKLANEQGDPTFVGFVFYVHRESLGRLELAMGGFSGKATRALADMLSKRADNFWPPNCKDAGMQVGIYIIEFQDAEEETDVIQAGINATANIIRVSENSIRRRF